MEQGDEHLCLPGVKIVTNRGLHPNPHVFTKVVTPGPMGRPKDIHTTRKMTHITRRIIPIGKRFETNVPIFSLGSNISCDAFSVTHRYGITGVKQLVVESPIL